MTDSMRGTSGRIESMLKSADEGLKTHDLTRSTATQPAGSAGRGPPQLR